MDTIVFEVENKNWNKNNWNKNWDARALFLGM